MLNKPQLARRDLLKAAGLTGSGLLAAGAWATDRAIADEPTKLPAPKDDGAGMTKRLAEFVVNTSSSDIPQAARREAVRSIQNYVGCAVGGSSHVTVERALEALSPFSGPPQASVMGRRQRLDVLQASLINGISSHVLDYDDTQLATIIHPAGPVASVLFPLAELRSMSGSDRTVRAAPRRFAMARVRSPMIPPPITSTVAFRGSLTISSPARQHAAGSVRAAVAGSRPAGRRWTA